MLIVTIELRPANPVKPRKILGVMRITNKNGLKADTKGNYTVEIDKGRKEDWAQAEVLNFPRQSLHAWHLIARALQAAGIK